VEQRDLIRNVPGVSDRVSADSTAHAENGDDDGLEPLLIARSIGGIGGSKGECKVNDDLLSATPNRPGPTLVGCRIRTPAA
jgi:hypothetical protein